MDKKNLVLLNMIERLSNFARSELRSGDNPYGLQPVHLQALSYIKQANRYSNIPQALTEYLGQTKGTVSQSLILLHRKGLIERYMDEVDKRQVRLVLSDKGTQLLKETAAASGWHTATRNLSPSKLKTTVQVLQDTLSNLQALEDKKTFGVCNTCLHCNQESERVFRCGLTGDKLKASETRKICRMHIPSA